MLDALFNQTPIPALEQFANFAQTRHSILASNVANFDVPGYRTRDLSVEQFQSQLKEAITARDNWSLGNPSPAQTGYGDPFAEVKQSLTSIVHHDETNVGLEQQIAEITKNQLQHNLAMVIMANQFRLLQAAISERV
jgi:flagellar basal-body rod protein FlgB